MKLVENGEIEKMLPYIIFIIVIFLLLCKVKKDKFDIYDILVLVVMILFSGLRYGIGVDYNLYEGMYLEESVGVSRTGIGYYYFSLFMHNLIPNTAVPLFFIISLLTCIGVYVFCKKKSVNPGMSIFLFITLGFYTTSFNIFRQMLSVALLLLGYTYWDKKKVLSIVFFILSVLFHQTALLAIAVIILVKLYKKPISSVALFIGGIVLIAGYNLLLGIVTNNIESMSIYASDVKYQPGIGTVLMLIVYFVFFVLINLNKYKLKDLNEKNIEYINIFSISYMVMMLGLCNILFVRLSNYMSIFIILLLPELYYNVYKLNKQPLGKIIVYACLIIYFFTYIFSFGGVIPYNSVLFL